MSLKAIQRNKGAAMLTAVIFFLVLASTIVLGIATPILKQVKIATDLMNSKESYFYANGAMEDALYRVRNGLDLAANETLDINGYTTTIALTTSGAYRIIDTESDSRGLVRKLRSTVIPGIGAAFNYGIQTGNGGLILGENARVIGNVYSNGNITGGNGSEITGSALAANSASLTTDQANENPTPINTCSSSTCVDFGPTTSTEDLAQSFQVSTTSQINKVALYLKRTLNSPSNLSVRIVTDDGGSPSNNELDSTTLDASLVTTNFGWVEATFPDHPELIAGTTYWIVADGINHASRYYTSGINFAYSSGTGKIGKYGETWTALTGSDDIYFRIYLGGLTATISGVNIGSGLGDIAHAHTINNTDVTGTLYCIDGTGNNKSCNTSRPDPSPTSFPISDGNIQQWKDEAASGTILNGNFIPTENASSGPIKIDGNALIDNGLTWNIEGTVWITGNFTAIGGSVIKLSPEYAANSATIVVDGRVTIENNVQFYNSGETGSYIMVLSTSDCPISSSCGGNYAIDVSNNAGTVILNAQRGTIHFNNNAGAEEAVANTLFMDNNSVVTYSSGLINVNFSSGPGGGWEIASWREVQ